MKYIERHSLNRLVWSTLCLAPLAVGGLAWASAPVVTGHVISWPDDGWYQVQRADDYAEVCAGGRQCEVEPGRYTVINHTTGQRFDSVIVTDTEAPATDVIIQDNTVSWPDNGWYQVLQLPDYTEVCAGGRSCTVDDGRYVVINHTTGERYENLHVPVSASPGTPGSSVTVDGNIIRWPNDGWYQVQRADDYQEECSGGRSCTVPNGIYHVINHTNGKRTDNLVVEGDSSMPVSDITVEPLIDPQLLSGSPDTPISLPRGLSHARALSDDGRYIYFHTQLGGIVPWISLNSRDILYRYDTETQQYAWLGYVAQPRTFWMGDSGLTGFFEDRNDNLNVLYPDGTSQTVKNLVPDMGINHISRVVASRDAGTVVLKAPIGLQGRTSGTFVYERASGSVIQLTPETVPFSDESDPDVSSWEIGGVSSISDDGNIIVFGGSISPTIMEDESGLVFSGARLIYDRQANEMTVTGRYAHRIFGSSPVFSNGFGALVSNDGDWVLYNALPESQWGEVASNPQVYLYQRDTGETTLLDGLLGGYYMQTSSDFQQLVYRSGENVIRYDTATQTKHTLTEAGWGRCYRACASVGSGFVPAISDDGSTVLFLEQWPETDAAEHPYSRLMIHDVATNTTVPLLSLLDSDTSFPSIDNPAINGFDISADGKTIVVSVYDFKQNPDGHVRSNGVNAFVIRR